MKISSPEFRKINSKSVRFLIGSAWAEQILIFSPNPPNHPGNNLSELIKALLSWLYLSFYWSEDDQNFREDLSKILDHIPIKIKMPNPNQEPPVSSKALNENLKDMNVLCTFKIKIELKFGAWLYQTPVTSDQIKIRFQTPVKNLQHPPKPQMRT